MGWHTFLFAAATVSLIPPFSPTFSPHFPKQYHFVPERRTWADALTYCKQNYDDLASVHNSEEQADIRQAATMQEEKGEAVWMGLYDDKDMWEWSLQDASSDGRGGDEFRSWASGQPDNLGGSQHCVAVLLPLLHNGPGENARGGWADGVCTDRKGSVCYDGKCYYWGGAL